MESVSERERERERERNRERERERERVVQIEELTRRENGARVKLKSVEVNSPDVSGS